MASISSLQLDAFAEIVRKQSFSLAAKALHVSQSALSQRVANLEKELGTTLLIRGEGAITPTSTGYDLLQYTSNREALEQEFRFQFNEKQKSPRGHLKIASLSSFVRPYLIPLLKNLKEKHPGLHFDVFTRELDDLENLLITGAADFILTEKPLHRAKLEGRLITKQRYVLCASYDLKEENQNIFIDINESDSVTADFWKLQEEKPASYKRIFIDDIYTILDGVEAGFGKALLPLELLKCAKKEIKVFHEFKALEVPVYFVFHKHEFWTRAQKLIIETLGKQENFKVTF